MLVWRPQAQLDAAAQARTELSARAEALARELAEARGAAERSREAVAKLTSDLAAANKCVEDEGKQASVALKQRLADVKAEYDAKLKKAADDADAAKAEVARRVEAEAERAARENDLRPQLDQALARVVRPRARARP